MGRDKYVIVMDPSVVGRLGSFLGAQTFDKFGQNMHRRKAEQLYAYRVFPQPLTGLTTAPLPHPLEAEVTHNCSD